MKVVTITAGGTYSITENMGRDITLYSASPVTLASDITVNYTDTPYEGLKLNIFAMCSFSSSTVRTINILGATYQHILFTSQNAMELTAMYLGGAWKIFSKSSNIVKELSAKMQDAKSITVSAGATLELANEKDRQRYTINGTLSIGSDYTIAYTGTPRNGQFYEFVYNGLVTYSGSARIGILGRKLTAQEALSENLHITALYTTGEGWSVKVLGEMVAVSPSQVFDFDVFFDNNTVKTLFDTPQVVINGTTSLVVNIISVYAQKVGATPYSATNAMQLYCEGSASLLFNNSVLLGLAGNSIQVMDTVPAPELAQVLSGGDILLKIATANPTGGGADNGIRIFGTYRLLNAV